MEETPPTTPPQDVKPCPSCKGAVPLNADYCPICGYNIKGVPYTTTTAPPGAQAQYPDTTYPGTYPPGAYPGYPGYKARTAKPTLAGILLIIAGLMELATGLIVAANGGSIADQTGIPGLTGILAGVGIVMTVIGVIAVIGGVLAMMRRLWPIAVVGGVVALFGIGPAFLGSILGLIGLVLVILSRDEF